MNRAPSQLLLCMCICVSDSLKDRQGTDCRVLLPFEVVLFCLVLGCSDPGGGDKE